MKKAIYVAIIAVIIVAIAFTALMLILKYDEKGEENMPFNITKISLISTTDASHVEDKKNLWHKSVEQDNDIYIYVEKNKEYQKTETIKSIKIDNFKIIEKPKKGEISIYKPSNNEKQIFENKEEYKTEQIIVNGTQKTEIQAENISNQGGIIAFRIANQKLGNYISNEKEINYDELLKKIKITYEEIKSKISFDLTIQLENEKQFKTTVELDIPLEKVIQQGKDSKEIENPNCIFKRIEN